MTHDDRLVRLLTDWLEDQPANAPEHLLADFLTDLDHTPQRAGWRAALRRLPMSGSNSLRFYGAVGAVALAAVLGLAVFGQSAFGPGLAPSPTPSPSPTPAPAAEATPRNVLSVLPDRELEPGTWYRADRFPVRVNFDVPGEGWVNGFIDSGAYTMHSRTEAVWLGFSLVANAYANPCRAVEMAPRLGPSVEDLAAALSGMPDVDVSGPTEVAVDGYAGLQVTLTVPDSLEGCITDPSGGPFYYLLRGPGGQNLWSSAGSTVTIMILDVDGTRLAIFHDEAPNATDEERAAAQQIIDSVRLEPNDPN